MLILATIIEGIASRKDKTMRITIGTQELTPFQASEVFSMSQQLCYVAIKKENFNPSEISSIETLKADYDNAKTPSQRLRGILFRNYEQESEGYKDFTTYYQAKIEKICEHYKSKLQ